MDFRRFTHQGRLPSTDFTGDDDKTFALFQAAGGLSHRFLMTGNAKKEPWIRTQMKEAAAQPLEFCVIGTI